jgi:hypothetical protein
VHLNFSVYGTHNRKKDIEKDIKNHLDKIAIMRTIINEFETHLEDAYSWAGGELE